MRHTLIPQNLKKSLRHEYRLRAIVVSLFMLSLAFVIGIISMFPTFVILRSEKNVADKALSSQQNIIGNHDNNTVGDELKKQTNTLALFNEQVGGKTENSRIIEDIVEVRKNVSITSLAISRPASTTMVVMIQGIAPTRDSLIVFKNSLVALNKGNSVDMPISGFTKSKDIPFSLTLKNESMP